MSSRIPARETNADLYDDDFLDNDDGTYESLQNTASDALDAAEALAPRTNSFVLSFVHEQGPTNAYVAWFSSRSRVLDFLANHITYVQYARGTDPYAIHASVERAVGKFRASPANLRLLIPKLNSLLRESIKIRWVGTLKELKEGNGRRERLLRLEFRREQKSEFGSRSIQNSEGAAFRDFIRENGLPEMPVRTGP